MSLNLGPQHADEFDGEVWEIYGDKLGGSELSQLVKLFDKRKGLPTRLARVLQSTLSPSNLPDSGI